MVYYPVPQDKLPVYAEQHWQTPVSESLATQVLSLPIWPEIEQSSLERTATILHRY
jgi:dTDP-4-amino-4,6-dideoxygalactose transaminase